MRAVSSGLLRLLGDLLLQGLGQRLRPLGLFGVLERAFTDAGQDAERRLRLARGLELLGFRDPASGLELLLDARVLREIGELLVGRLRRVDALALRAQPLPVRLRVEVALLLERLVRGLDLAVDELV